MKLAVAAGLLAQTLPVLSETKLSTLLSSRQNHKSNERYLRVGTLDKVASHQIQRSSSSRYDRIKGTRARVLENRPAASLDGKDQLAALCDPTSIDPDVGVLSCGLGKLCTPHLESVFGGICTPAKKPRTDVRLRQSKTASRATRGKKWAARETQGRRLKNQDRDSRSCDPRSSDPDTGVLSCKEGRHCNPNKRSPLGGECIFLPDDHDSTTKRARFALRNQGPFKNIRMSNAQTSQIECDPTVADIGLLSCGADESCVRNNSTKMGGICVASISRRRTSSVYYGPSSFCDPSYENSVYTCDCEDFDSTTMSGSITCTHKEEICFGTLYYGCYETCGFRSFSQVIEGDTYPAHKNCFNFSTPRAEFFCWSYSSDGTNCKVEFNDETCNSCSYAKGYISFDCSNVPGGPISSGDGQPIASLQIIEECNQPVDGQYCNLCGYDMFIPYSNNDNLIALNGFGDTLTCYGLQQANWNSQISADKCPDASAVAQSGCCVYRCDLCGWGAIIPNQNDASIITVGGEQTTCGALQALAGNYSISKDQCSSVSTAASACCEATCYVCNYSFMPYGRLDTSVNIPDFENILTCRDLQSAAYPYWYGYESRNISIYGDSCPVVAEIAESTCCASFCNLCGYDGVIPSHKFDVPVSVPGFEQITTCRDLQYSAYSYFNITGESCPTFSAIAESNCCSNICNVCNSSFIPYNKHDTPLNVPGHEYIATCGDFYYAAYRNVTITDESCPAFAEIAGSNCCAYYCDICGPNAYISDFDVNVANVPGIGNATCGRIAYDYGYDLNSESCPIVGAFVRDTCCSDIIVT